MALIKERTSIVDARGNLFRYVHPVTAAETVRIEESYGRIVAADIVAGLDVPHYRRAAMDGFAVIAEDTAGATAGAPVILKLGDAVSTGLCVNVHTGSSMPDGADAVLMLEDADVFGSAIHVKAQVHPFKNVGEVGEDVRKGEQLYRPGHQIRASDIGLLASLGYDEVEVYVKPKVSIIPTGEEIIARSSGIKPEEGEILGTNDLMISMLVERWGGTSHVNEVVKDDLKFTMEAIKANTESDIIVTIGGTSVGRRDFVPGAVSSIGKILAHGIAMSPGKPTAMGVVDGTPVICLPGYPVACYLASVVFLRHVIRMSAHIPERPDPCARARLGAKITSRIGYRTYTRVTMKDGTATPIMTAGSGILSSVAKSDGFVVIPESMEGYDEGTEVEVITFE